jgi:hypothetical protein
MEANDDDFERSIGDVSIGKIEASEEPKPKLAKGKSSKVSKENNEQFMEIQKGLIEMGDHSILTITQQ